jgi:hypothetical protein
MKIYEIRESVRANVIVDTDQSFDEVLFFNPLQKKLIYAYAKASSKPEKLSFLLNLFKPFEDIDYFYSETHKDLMGSDECYSAVVKKYVRNPHVWVTSIQKIQPYLFDSKYLLIGRYQSIAEKCTGKYMFNQTMHWSGIHNGCRTLEGLVENNGFFLNRRSLESEFFDPLMKVIKNNNLFVNCYWNKIEIYDELSKLTLQLELSSEEISPWILFPLESRNKGRKQNIQMILKIFSKYPEIFSLYTILNSQLNLVSEYLKKYEALTKTETFVRLEQSVNYMLEDFIDKNEGAYYDKNWLLLYFVNRNSVERVTIQSFTKNKIRLYRKVKYTSDRLNRVEERDIRGYYMYTTETLAKELILSGLINVGNLEEPHPWYDYELLSKGLSDAWSLQFFKLPYQMSERIFYEYDEVQDHLKSEILYAQASSEDLQDTRILDRKYDASINCYFELVEKNNNPQKFKLERSSRMNLKSARIVKFRKELQQKLIKIKTDDNT